MEYACLQVHLAILSLALFVLMSRHNELPYGGVRKWAVHSPPGGLWRLARPQSVSILPYGAGKVPVANWDASLQL